MKNKFIFNLFAVTLILFMGSCENDASVDPPPFEKKPVIISLISPLDDSIRAQLTYTKPYYGVPYAYSEVEYVLGANVSLTDLSDPAKLPLNLPYNSYGVYSESVQKLPIVSGHSYRMDVKLTDGSHYYAVTYVPAAPDLSKFKMNFAEAKDDISSNGYYGTGSFTLDLEYDGGLSDKYYISPVLQTIIKNTSDDTLTFDVMLTDKFVQGDGNNPISFLVKQNFTKQSWSGLPVDGPWTVERIEGTVYTCDAALKNYNITQDGNNIGSDFFREVQPILWNFKGGALGVLGGYNFTQGVIWKK